MTEGRSIMKILRRRKEGKGYGREVRKRGRVQRGMSYLV
jgi:hypothetical protein